MRFCELGVNWGSAGCNGLCRKGFNWGGESVEC